MSCAHVTMALTIAVVIVMRTDMELNARLVLANISLMCLSMVTLLMQHSGMHAVYSACHEVILKMKSFPFHHTQHLSSDWHFPDQLTSLPSHLRCIFPIW